MTDITAELAALPKIPKPDFYDPPVAWMAYVTALEARLAIAERELRSAMDAFDGRGSWWVEDARAYLAHRAKEKP